MMETKIVAVTLCTLGNLLAYIVVGATGKDLFDAGMISLGFQVLLFLITLVIFNP